MDLACCHRCPVGVTLQRISLLREGYDGEGMQWALFLESVCGERVNYERRVPGPLLHFTC